MSWTTENSNEVELYLSIICQTAGGSITVRVHSEQCAAVYVCTVNQVHCTCVQWTMAAVRVHNERNERWSKVYSVPLLPDSGKLAQK